MSSHRALGCDSCNFRRDKINMDTLDDADGHELANADHWVQIVDVED